MRVTPTFTRSRVEGDQSRNSALEIPGRRGRVRVGAIGVALAALVMSSVHAQETSPYPIDLATTLRLSHAQNLDVQIARERLTQAKAEHGTAIEQLFPWISVGGAYRRHEGRTQAVDGALLDVDKQTIARGAIATAQVDLGEAIFRTLSSKQLVGAATAGVDAQEQSTTLEAAQEYFDLLRTKLLADVIAETLRTSEDYQRQVGSAVNAGLVFKGDELRVQTQSERYRSSLSQAREQQRVASARLAQTLHLDPTIELTPQDNELVPVAIVDATNDVQPLVRQALTARPDLKQQLSLIAAARDAKRAAVYGPLVPSLGVQAFLGDLGGGVGSATGDYGSSRDYYVGLSWRFGPGGLFDVSRIHSADSQLRVAELTGEKANDEIRRQVVESYTRVRALSEQITATRESVRAASETWRLTRQRKQLGVGVILEDIQAQQELLRARADHLNAIAEFNKAQYVLSKVTGQL